MKRRTPKQIQTLAMILGVTSALCASAPHRASAQEANGFGEKGQLILTVDRLMPLVSYSSQSETVTTQGLTTKTSDSGTSAALLFGSEPALGVVHTLPRVAFDFTVIHHLTLGGSIAVAFGLGGKREVDAGNGTPIRTTDTPSMTVFGFAPRVGYVIPLGHSFAFWPRVGVALYSVSRKSEQTGGNGNTVLSTTTNTDTLFSLDVDPQFVWTPVQHFFFHAGPLLNVPISGSRSVETAIGVTSTTSKSDLSLFHIGLSAGLGGWFDL